MIIINDGRSNRNIWNIVHVLTARSLSSSMYLFSWFQISAYPEATPVLSRPSTCWNSPPRRPATARASAKALAANAQRAACAVHWQTRIAQRPMRPIAAAFSAMGIAFIIVNHPDSHPTDLIIFSSFPFHNEPFPVFKKRHPLNSSAKARRDERSPARSISTHTVLEHSTANPLANTSVCGSQIISNSFEPPLGHLSDTHYGDLELVPLD